MTKALVTPSVLRWARESMRFSLEEASRKIHRPVEEIQSWESGESQPTLAQARKIAEVYKRPLAVFFLAEPPEDFQTLRDFRRIPQEYAIGMSTELALLLRETQYRQERLQDYLKAEGFEEIAFVGAASLKNNPQELAQKIRSFFKINIGDQIKCSTREAAFKLWMSQIEKEGVIVFRQSDVDCKEIRGFAICDKYAPFIFINSNDSIAGQLFSLIHELVHLALNLSGISNLENNFYKKVLTPEDRIEFFCNKVAAETLVDEARFNAEWNVAKGSLEERIESLSKIFKVSQEVIARRLCDKSVIPKTEYQRLRTTYQEEWEKYKKQKKAALKNKPGGPSPHLMKVVENGYSYTRIVLSGYFNGKLTGSDVSHLLGAKINHLPKIASYVQYA